MELQTELPDTRARGRSAAALGLASAALLYASIHWAHHWGVVADSIVAARAVATAAALGVSIWSLLTTRASRRLARLGLALAPVSLLALALVGLLFAAGLDPAGACGGG